MILDLPSAFDHLLVVSAGFIVHDLEVDVVVAACYMFHDGVVRRNTVFFAAHFFVCVYNCVGVTMEFYHDVLVSTSSPDREAYAIVGVELDQRFIPYVYFLILDARERHFRKFLCYHWNVWRGDLGGLG